MDDLSQRLAKLPPEKRKLLEEKLSHKRKHAKTESKGIRKRGSTGPAPLSQSQKRLWFLHRLEPVNTTYHIPLVLKLDGLLDIAALETAISTVVNRHEILRTTFREVDGDPVQIARPPTPTTLDIVDVGRDESMAVAEALSCQPFDLSNDTPVRFSLLRIDDTESWLLIVIHHIVSDAWSFNIIQNELIKAYTGHSKELQELPVQYADVATWQRDNEANLASQLTYWRKNLADAAPVDLPSDRLRPAKMGYAGARIRTDFPIHLIESLEAVAKRNNATLYMVFLAALNIVMGRLSGQNDICIGSPIAGRTRSEFESLVGVFINTLVMRNDLSGDPSFPAFLERVREVTLGAYSNQDIAFEKLIEELKPKRDLSRPPFFQVLLVLQNQQYSDEKMGGVTITRDFIETGSSMFDLTFYIHPRPDHYLVKLEYSTELFEQSTAQRLLAYFRTVLESIVRSPDCEIGKLSIQPSIEKQLVLETWNQSEVDYDRQQTVHQMIAAQAKETPQATAVEIHQQSCTYGELEARSNRIARHLQGLGVTTNKAVGIYLERSIEMVAALLGVLKSGGYYVPLDPMFPSERLAYMVKDSGLQVLLSESSLADQILVLGDATSVLLDRDASAIAMHSGSPIESRSTVNDLAYVIYTSGSTGLPKGVAIQHRALTNFLHAMRAEPSISDNDRLLAVTTLSFDIAGLELYLPLITGACVLLASREESIDARLLATRITTSKATMMQGTPATWRMLIDSGWKGSSNLKILCGGEALSKDLAAQLIDRCAELWNMYGPTETTIWSLVKRINANDDVPILVGRPIANTTVYILDTSLEPLPIGATGELLIGGDGLAAGYLNRSELTEERFIPHPFRTGERLYRTGDLARYRSDGQVEILGRIDHQVKVRGFRIELGEIESALDAHPAIEQALVAARPDAMGENTLVAYYVSNDDVPTSNVLRDHLKNTLPDYMVPSFFMNLEEFPLTPNGKIDRKVLPQPDASQRATEDAYQAPSNELEEKLTQIWAEVLGIGKVGIHDNFFDLGGHSLLALRLVSKIEHETGIKLPLIVLFQGQTIADIATNSERSGATLPNAFSPIRSEGSLPPFFAIGSHPRYVDVAAQIDRQRPFYRLDIYALQSRRLAEGLKAHRDVESLLNEFVEAIQTQQPSGPYLLGGGCEGALTAFAIATELQKRGEEVAKLILWITPAPNYGNGAVFGKAAFFRVLDQFKTTLRHLQMSDFNTRTLFEIMKHEYIEFRIFRAMDSYRPTRKFDGPITVARTVANRKPWDTDLAMGWGELATQGTTVHELPGNHDTWLNDYAAEFGDFLDSCLSSPGDV